MHSLFQFFYRHRSFLFFLALETFCLWLIVKHNGYQGASFFNTSNYYAGQVLSARNNVAGYFKLTDVNRNMAYENAQLRELLIRYQQSEQNTSLDTVDFLRENQFSFIPAKVINNSVARANNFITLNKGAKDGIKPDMGVIAAGGVVGRVKAVSNNFSTVVSLLNSGMKVASKIKGKNIDCTVEWDGADPAVANLLYVVRHHKISVGDTIVTSEYNAIYPAGVMIGTIEDFKLDQGRSDYDIRVRLSVDFTKLSYVYAIDNSLRQERDSLELISRPKEGK
ncbi:rod shape-determining protein MreC [Cytophagaceae bacterium ABcell3]|nr:rod shape-determining protein MreC [Cytophagaceae bacterium ABcell3]